MLSWIFGKLRKNVVHVRTHDRSAGYLEFDKARVRWFLSIDFDTLPDDVKNKGKRTFRSMTINGEEIEFSDGFTDLHNLSYIEILNGRGFHLKDSEASIEIVHEIRNTQLTALIGDYHPFAKLHCKKHPFKL